MEIARCKAQYLGTANLNRVWGAHGGTTLISGNLNIGSESRSTKLHPQSTNLLGPSSGRSFAEITGASGVVASDLARRSRDQGSDSLVKLS